MVWKVVCKDGASGLSPAGLRPDVPPTATPQVSPDARDKLRNYHVCKVLTYNQLLSFGQKSPKVPIRVGNQGQEAEESLVFPLCGFVWGPNHCFIPLGAQ